MKSSSTGTLTIPENQDEPRAEYLLRVAAAYISAYCPDQLVIYDDTDEPCDGGAIVQDIEGELAELASLREKAARSMEFTGKIIQAGHDPEDRSGPVIKPTVTIVTSESALKACKSIPFYQSANILITPITRIR